VERSVILLLLVGGPSQLETWDPKPEAPAEVRGPFQSIATRCAGVWICEHLPRMALRMDRLALVRSVHHDTAPIHEAGYQLLQTGRLCCAGEESPHFGSVVARLKGARDGVPPSVIIPGPITSTGIDIPRGQSAGWLGDGFQPWQVAAEPSAAGIARAGDGNRTCGESLAVAREPINEAGAWDTCDLKLEGDKIREAYGPTAFGRSCLLARRLIESGVRAVTVNMFDTVFDRVTWDCHGAAPFSTLNDYARELLPCFDQAFTALIDDLERRGRLETTLVVAAGEFGRTPWLNASGGRDHWPGVWSVVLAGGGVRGGQVIGASDARAAAPQDRPVKPADLLATIYYALGISPCRTLRSPDGARKPLVDDGHPIKELFT
jgi:hypothetical protein